MILFWHKTKEGENSRVLLERALLAYCAETGKRKPRKKNRAVAEGEHGKPYYPVLASVFCSVSHSGGYWVALFDGHPCGVDIEARTRIRASEAVIRRKFTDEEQALFPELLTGGGADEATFLRVWTRKEAYLKYTGEGLSRGLLSFSVAERNADGRTIFRIEQKPYYGESHVALKEIAFEAVKDADGNPLPLIGAFCGTPGEFRILALPEEDPETVLETAKEIALDYVEAKMRTEKEIREKLREKGIAAEQTEDVLAFLREYGFADDAAYAKRYAEYAAEKGYGPLRIERDLARKGLAGNLIKEAIAAYEAEKSEALAEAEPERETRKKVFSENAETLARKTYEAAGENAELDEKLAAKILRKLASRGYGASESYGALETLRREIRVRNE